jgi:hypothetical protein
MWVLFVAGLIGCVDSRHLVHGTQHQHLVTFGGIALSLAAGSYVMRREPLKSWLKTRKVMWFLFLFNLAVAVAAPFLIHGSQGIFTAAGMGIVSLGAGMGLLKGRASAPQPACRGPAIQCQRRPSGGTLLLLNVLLDDGQGAPPREAARVGPSNVVAR